MQLTRFHVLIRDFPLPGEHVLYNTLTDGLVGLDDRALDWIGSLDDGRPVAPLDASELDYLVSEGFVVADDAGDDDALREFMLGVKQGDGVLRLRVLVTESCNFACGYCYEEAGGPRGPGMGRTVEEALHGWVRRRMARYDLHTLELTFFGGEPLLKKPLILRAAARLKRELEADGRAFRCNLITNGLLLDRPFVDAMVPLGLEWVKVTLDGPEETHDAARVRRDGSGTWRRIVENLVAVAGRVHLTIGANVPEGREDEYGRLLEALRTAGLADAIDDVRFHKILGAGASSAPHATPMGGPGLVRLQWRAHGAGLGKAPALDRGPCGLHMDHYLLVDAGGYLYKCDHLVGDPKAAVGRITDERWLPRVEALEALDPVKECGRCEYLPICAGGCRAVTWRETGTLGAACEHDHFETAGRDILKQRYLDEFYEGEMPSLETAA